MSNRNGKAKHKKGSVFSQLASLRRMQQGQNGLNEKQEAFNQMILDELADLNQRLEQLEQPAPKKSFLARLFNL